MINIKKERSVDDIIKYDKTNEKYTPFIKKFKVY